MTPLVTGQALLPRDSFQDQTSFRQPFQIAAPVDDLGKTIAPRLTPSCTHMILPQRRRRTSLAKVIEDAVLVVAGGHHENGVQMARPRS